MGGQTDRLTPSTRKASPTSFQLRQGSIAYDYVSELDVPDLTENF
ncbi:hypothetical protein [Rhizobium sp. P32RR-XVIII]|nr:hypothetical protein [Rhizobium sp. P32RR-XVIII]